MTTDECYDFLIKYYGNEKVAQDMCNFFDSAVLTEYVEFLKDEG
jgi:hypothetical protein